MEIQALIDFGRKRPKSPLPRGVSVARGWGRSLPLALALAAPASGLPC